jgi:Cof subfamily protein (haloacid dehalogenase superfamily)
MTRQGVKVKGKIIFFDIDGTLLDHDKKLPASSKEAIQALRKKGHAVAIATGRGPFMFRELREELEIDAFISFNGQYVEWKGEAIYTNPIKPELLQAITDLALGNEHPIVYMDHDAMKTGTHYHAYVEESIASLKVPQPGHDPDYYKNRNIYQCLLFCTYGEEESYKERFKELDFIRWHQFSTDVLPLGGSKARGIEKMIEKLGYDKSEVYAFGDHLNDIEMLEFVGTGVAMGNAPDIVKKAADFVTKDVSEDGILHGLRLVGLL